MLSVAEIFPQKCNGMANLLMYNPSCRPVRRYLIDPHSYEP